MGKKAKKRKKDKQAKQGKGAKQRSPEAQTVALASADADAEIREAEARLAAALRKVDEARDELTQREQELTAVMQRHGRVPPPATMPPIATGLGQRWQGEPSWSPSEPSVTRDDEPGAAGAANTPPDQQGV